MQFFLPYTFRPNQLHIYIQNKNERHIEPKRNDKHKTILNLLIEPHLKRNDKITNGILSSFNSSDELNINGMLLSITLNWRHPQIQLYFLAPLIERGTRTVALWPIVSKSLCQSSSLSLLVRFAFFSISLPLVQPLSVWLCTAWLLHLRNHTSKAPAAAAASASAATSTIRAFRELQLELELGA